MTSTATVTVLHPDQETFPGETMVINQADYNPALHKLPEPPKPAKAAATAHAKKE